MSKLSSGKRLNQFSDDIGSSGKSTGLEMKIRHAQRMNQNLQDQLSFLHTKDGALDQMIDMSQRVRELIIQGKNGILMDQDQSAIKEEIEQLKTGISEIYQEASFNDIRLFKDPRSDLKTSMDALMEVKDYFTDSFLDRSDSLFKDLLDERCQVGAETQGTEACIRLYDNQVLNERANMSLIQDADMAKEVMELTKARIKHEASTYLMAQVNKDRSTLITLLK